MQACKPLITTSAPCRCRLVVSVPRRTPVARRATYIRQAGSTSTTTAASQAPETTEPLSVWLVTKDAMATVQFEALPEGKGQAVVVVEVEPGSAAAEAGIVRGQRLVGISDPVRDVVWDLLDRPSMRFIRDTLRMRRMGNVQFLLKDYLNVSDPAWASRTGLNSQDESQLGEAGQAGASMDDGSSLPGRSGLDSLISDGEEDRPMTVGERMAAQYQAREQGAKQKTEVAKRMERRAAYMELEAQRDDRPLIAGLAVAFLGPALIILGVAAGTGYLDKLYSASLTLN